MTKGSIIKGITKFAIPCILIRVIQNLYPLLDALIVGKVLDLNSLSAVGVAGSLYSLFNETLLGLVSGFAIIASRKFGAEKHEEVPSVFFNTLLLSTALCGILALLCLEFSKGMLALLRTPAELMSCAEEYLSVLFWGLIPNMLYNFIGEMLRAVGNSKIPLWLLIISSVLHLALLYPLTAAWGVRGTALSTVISYAVTVLLAAAYIRKKIPAFHFSFRTMQPDRCVIKESLGIGTPMALTSFVVMLGVLLLSFVTNNIGTEYVAAYSTASKIGYIMTTPIFGFATALAVFVSQNFGAGEYTRIEKGVQQTMLLVMGVNACAAALLLALLRPILTSVFDGNTTAIDAGCLYLYIRAASMLVLTPAALYKSILPAIGKPLFSTLSGFLEIGVRFLFPMLLAQVLGFSVVPLTDTFTWCILAAMLMISYHFEFAKCNKDGLKHEKQVV